tara:strand:+ start:362 stop:532 length:171 start_codon:yes stop_codon:yes gene_type:complete
MESKFSLIGNSEEFLREHLFATRKMVPTPITAKNIKKIAKMSSRIRESLIVTIALL